MTAAVSVDAPRARRRHARAASTVAVLAVVLVLTSVLGSPRSAAQTDTPAGADPITLTGQSGWVAPTGTFAVNLRLAAVASDATLVVRLYSRVSTSARLAATARGENLGGPIQPAIEVPLDQAQHSGDQVLLRFPLVTNGDVPPYGLRIGTAGVYPVTFSVLGADGQETGRVVTHLVRLPAAGSGQQALAVAMVVPVHAPVSHDPTGASAIDAPTLAGLEGLITELGRHPAVPLTLNPTPETVDALAERDRSTGAPSLVTALAKASGNGRQVVGDSYVPVEQGAWVSQGLSPALGAQYEAGAATLTSQLDTPIDRRTLVVNPTTTPEVLSDSVDRGTRASVVPSDLIVPVDRRTAGDTITQTFDLTSSNDDRIPSVAADSRLGRLLVDGDNPALSAHEVLAELALLALDQSRYQPCVLSSADTSGCRRGLALELPTSASDSSPVAAALLDAFADPTGTGGTAATPPGAPLASAVTVDGLLGVVDRASASFRTRPPGGAVLVRQLVAASPPSLGNYPGDLRAAQTTVAGFRSMTVPGDPKGTDIATSLDQVVLSSGAVGFDDATRSAYLDGARATVAAQVSRVTAPDQLVVTLTSTRARVPISIENALDYPVKVVLKLASAKLEFPEGATQTIDLPPNQPTRIEIPVQTRASGSFPLDVTVWSPDGGLPIASTRVTVRSTAVSGVGLALTIAAGLFLVLWWGRHFRNARRDKRLIGSAHPVLKGMRDTPSTNGTDPAGPAGQVTPDAPAEST